MLRHWTDFDIYRNHVILNNIRKLFVSKANDQLLSYLFDRNTLFLYPKIFTFSFTSYPTNITDFKNPFSADNHHANNLPDFANTESVGNLSSETYLSFSRILRECFDELNLKMIFILDLRKIGLLKKSLISHFLKDISQTKSEIIIFASDDITDETLSGFQEGLFKICFSVFDLQSQVEQLSAVPEHNVSLLIDETLSLEGFEKCFSSIDLISTLPDKLFITLDFRHTYNINIFSLSLINHFLHDFWNHFGILFIFSFGSIRFTVIKQFSDFRFFKVNWLFNFDTKPPKITLRFSPRIFGGYLFDRNRVDKIINRFDNYLYSVREMFHSYLDEHITITHEYPNTSYKTRRYWLTYYQIIGSIFYEIVDNALLHSKGVGYCSAQISKYCLYLFVGDCGIGLFDGILNTYDLEEIIGDEDQAIIALQSLPYFHEKRKVWTKDKLGAGIGIADTLTNIFRCHGKVAIRSGNTAFFMSPVAKGSKAKIVKSSIKVKGTQYMIIIPLFKTAKDNLPATYEDFLKMEVS